MMNDFFMDFSILEDETTTLFRNVGQQPSRDATPNSRKKNEGLNLRVP
jgi:hypothetical protein